MCRVSTPQSTRLDHETYWTLHVADRGGEAMILAREASSRIWNTQRKVMNEDSFRTDNRIKKHPLAKQVVSLCILEGSSRMNEDTARGWGAGDRVQPPWLNRELGTASKEDQGRRPTRRHLVGEGHNMQGFEHKTNSKYRVLAGMGHLFCIQTRFSL